MFVDASAIVAVLTGEPDADALADTLDAARAPITSAVAVFEATLGLCRKRHASVAEAQADVAEFLAMAGVRTVSITAREAEAALDAFSRYGKGRGHPASSTWGTASPTRWPEPTGQPFCSKATTSAKPMSSRHIRQGRPWQDDDVRRSSRSAPACRQLYLLASIHAHATTSPGVL